MSFLIEWDFEGKLYRLLSTFIAFKAQMQHPLVFFIFQVHDSFNKIKLSKADLSCFKNKKKCWSLNDTPTISEDLFPAGNGEAFDIVRNSDFMVSQTQILKVNHLPAKIKLWLSPAFMLN